jgi:cysteine-rich repeat protein
MRWFSVLVFSLFCLVSACSDNAASTRVCTPGSNVFCRCINREQGTKKCNAAGDGYETECRLGENLPCPDGEEVDASVEPFDAGPPPPPVDAASDAPSLCGNRVVDTNEGCDDGNRLDGDGCSANCEPQGIPVTAGTCPGMSVHIWGSRAVEVSGNTAPYENRHDSDRFCDSNTFGIIGKDRVYAVVPHKSGKMVVETANATFDTAIFIRTTCDNKASEVACAAKVVGNGGERLEYNVIANNTYYVFLDGAAGQPEGDCIIRFSVQ